MDEALIAQGRAGGVSPLLSWEPAATASERKSEDSRQQGAHTPRSPRILLPGPTWSDRRWLFLLITLTLLLRVCQIANTELTTRDSIAYIRAAWRLDHEPWGHVIKSETQHPGYAFTVWLVAKPVCALIDADLPRAMQYSAQVAAALASVLLAVGLYFLGKELFDRRVGFWASLVFQVLPSSGRLMADGLSEPLFLMLSTWALYFAARALKGGGRRWFALTGLCTGLAYLTRTEGLLIVPVLLFVLVGLQYSRWHRTRHILAREAIVACVACALVAGPFMLHIGGISLKASYDHVMKREGWKLPARAPDPGVVVAPLPLALWNIGPDVTPQDRYLWAAKALVIILDKSFLHILSLPALIGVWVFRRSVYDAPGMWILFLSGMVLAALLWKLGQSAGYIGERHVLLIVMGGVLFAVASLAALGGWLARGRHAWFSLLLMLGVVGFCLPRTLARLHGNRAGFREAGVWLAQHALPGDEIYDPLAWAGFHSGRMFAPPDAPASTPRVCYVVLERSENTHPHLWFLLELGRKLVKGHKAVYRLPVARKGSKADILIFRVPRPADQDPTGIELNQWLGASMRR